MTLDPQMASTLERLQVLYENEPDPVTVGAVEQRRLSRLALEIFNTDLPTEVEVTRIEIPGPAGPIGARLYDPGAGALSPGLIYIHGGGWVVCDLDTHDSVARRLATATGFRVVSIDYRLAPEHKFPLPLDDCLAATRWLLQNGARWRIDMDRLTIAGDSAGANLALGTLLRLREAGEAVCGGVLIYGAYEPACAGRSYDAWGDKDYVLTTDRMLLFWEMYLRSPTDRTNPWAAPLTADLNGLPPLHIITAEMDPLLDDSLRLLSQLREVGQPVSYSEYSGVVHGFVNMAGLVEKGAAALQDAGAFLSRVVEV